MIASEDPSLVFLMEIKLSKEEMTRKKYTLGFTEGLVMASNGSKGGLALLWKKYVMVDIQTFGPWHIDVEVGGTDGSGKWRFTGFMGNRMRVRGRRHGGFLRGWGLLTLFPGCV